MTKRRKVALQTQAFQPSRARSQLLADPREKSAAGMISHARVGKPDRHNPQLAHCGLRDARPALLETTDHLGLARGSGDQSPAFPSKGPSWIFSPVADQLLPKPCWLTLPATGPGKPRGGQGRAKTADSGIAPCCPWKGKRVFPRKHVQHNSPPASRCGSAEAA